MSKLGDALMYGVAQAIENNEQAKQAQKDTELREAFETGRKRQRNEDLYDATRAFLELGATDEKIYQVLSKHMHVAELSKAIETLQFAKTSLVRMHLKEFYETNGLQTEELQSIDFDQLVASNPRIVNMTGEKLKTAVDEKHKKG